MDTLADLDALYADHLARMAAVTGRALGAGGYEALVIAAGSPRNRFQDDQTDPFVANPDFKAWVPVANAPGSFLVHVPGERPLLLFHQPEDYWHKPPSIPDAGWTRAVEIRAIRHPAEARAHLPARAAYLGEPFAGLDDWGFAACNPPALLALLHYARAVKSPYELACMRVASRLGARAHTAAAAAFAAGASSFEIHLAYLEACEHEEAELPYRNIIALNDAAAILHYHDLERQPPAVRRSLLIDAGAQCRGYAADITRTHAAATSPFSDLLAGVEALQLELCEMVVPGAAYPDIHVAAHRLTGELLAELGIVRCSADAAVASGLTRVFFPHGIGHLLGLQVHDIGGHQGSERGETVPPPAEHPFLRLTRRLEADTVVTIEPGIYFIDLLLQQARADGRGRDIDWDTVADLKPYGGVRIEDNVRAVAGKPENLTRDAFAALDAGSYRRSA